jgi:hypothetical protein
MKQIGVDCRFSEEGTVRIFRIFLDQTWISVEQGRQWVDRLGSHVLIMLPDNTPIEICLCSDTMTWQIRSRDNQAQQLV